MLTSPGSGQELPSFEWQTHRKSSKQPHLCQTALTEVSKVWGHHLNNNSNCITHRSLNSSCFPVPSPQSPTALLSPATSRKKTLSRASCSLPSLFCAHPSVVLLLQVWHLLRVRAVVLVVCVSALRLKFLMYSKNQKQVISSIKASFIYLMFMDAQHL